MIKIVIAGEVDSGKSTLIGRLLFDTDSITLGAKEEFKKTCRDLGRPLEFAYLLDSFQEERQDEFTLDTTQALLKTAGREFLLIDVPGHRQLLENMLTGTSYADTAALVIDLNKSLEEQTKRHLYILKFLGIDTVIIVINKIDTVRYNQDVFSKVESQIKGFLKSWDIRADYIIPVSAKEGLNLIHKPEQLKWYSGPSFIEALNTLVKKEKDFDFRFPIQDIYKVKNETVAVGMLASGNVQTGDFLRILPSGAEVKLKAIKVFNRIKRVARCGESVGLVLNPPEAQIKRGQVVYSGKPPYLAAKIQAKIFCLSALNLDEVLSIACAAQEVLGKISRIKESMDTASWQKNQDSSVLEALDAAQVTIDLREPLVIERFPDLPELGRLVLKKDEKICALGIIEEILN